MENINLEILIQMGILGCLLVIVFKCIQIEDNLESYKKIVDIIDISGGLETSWLKDISKINIFLNKVKQINDEA